MEIQKTKLKNVLLFKPIIFNDFRGAYTEVFNEKDYFDFSFINIHFFSFQPD